MPPIDVNQSLTREPLEKSCEGRSASENSNLLRIFFPEKKQKYAIVMGNEVKGVQQEVVNASDLCIEIPQLGTKHSLNISVTTGVVLWDLFQKLQ